jgi:hypothetical protein
MVAAFSLIVAALSLMPVVRPGGNSDDNGDSGGSGDSGDSGGSGDSRSNTNYDVDDGGDDDCYH